VEVRDCFGGLACGDGVFIILSIYNRTFLEQISHYLEHVQNNLLNAQALSCVSCEIHGLHISLNSSINTTTLHLSQKSSACQSIRTF
jgi:hypothetical protein